MTPREKVAERTEQAEAEDGITHPFYTDEDRELDLANDDMLDGMEGLYDDE